MEGSPFRRPTRGSSGGGAATEAIQAIRPRRGLAGTVVRSSGEAGDRRRRSRPSLADRSGGAGGEPGRSTGRVADEGSRARRSGAAFVRIRAEGVPSGARAAGVPARAETVRAARVPGAPRVPARVSSSPAGAPRSAVLRTAAGPAKRGSPRATRGIQGPREGPQGLIPQDTFIGYFLFLTAPSGAVFFYVPGRGNEDARAGPQDPSPRQTPGCTRRSPALYNPLQ